jgi:hypothetical protein
MDLIDNYTRYHVSKLHGLHITSSHIQSLISELDSDVFNTVVVGYSEEMRPVYRISIGNGSRKILLWSQMHGDESTATKSIFDLFTYVNINKFTNVINNLLHSCTIYFIPILNPDGAERYTRENCKGLDLNRDAKTLLNSESRILQEQIELINPDFAFNLHDQTAWYNVDQTDHVATISLLAPAADEERTLTESRKKAMSVIVTMNEVLQSIIPNKVGRYNDSFCDSCFGDRIQSFGIPTILIECGYFPDDEEREVTRKLHTIVLLQSLISISSDNFPNYHDYFKIPVNEKRFYDLKIKNVSYNGVLTEVGVRVKRIFSESEQKLLKIIDETETISGNELNDKLFHREIDANGTDFNNFC